MKLIWSKSLKIALACQSMLLEKSLEIFLKGYITPYKQCDFVISDKNIEIDKPIFYIADEKSDLVLPFSKSTLMLKIEKFYDSKFKKEPKVKTKKVDTKKLEKEITKLTDNFRNDLVSIIKEYYETTVQ
jgi:predicted ribosome quality control (RQC) complex YloA/Tae2 family protein